MMKRLFIIVVCLLFLVGCDSKTSNIEITSEKLVEVLSSVESFDQYIIYTAETDTNELLGRPNQYIGKATFSDSRCEQYEGSYTGGTFEYFNDKDDCKSRHSYLLKLSDPSFGVFGVNQYIYKYSTVILRIDFALTQEQAEEYRDVVTAFLGETPDQNY